MHSLRQSIAGQDFSTKGAYSQEEIMVKKKQETRKQRTKIVLSEQHREVYKGRKGHKNERR